MTPSTAFGYGSVLTFILTAIFVFILLVIDKEGEAPGIAFVGMISASLQGCFWACNK